MHCFTQQMLDGKCESKQQVWGIPVKQRHSTALSASVGGRGPLTLSACTERQCQREFYMWDINVALYLPDHVPHACCCASQPWRDFRRWTGIANILIRLGILINFKHIKLCLVMQQRYLGLVYHWLSWPRMSQGGYHELNTSNSGIRRVQGASKGLPLLGS